MIVDDKYKNSVVNFEAIKYRTFNDIKVPSKFRALLYDKNHSVDCFVSSQKDNEDICISVLNKNFEELGMGRFNVDENTLCASSINSFSGLKGVGSILHLSQIISMLENNIDKIKLFSLGNAIPFHSKFMFKSAINSRIELVDFLVEEILLKIKDNPKYSYIVGNIEQWFRKKNLSDSEKILQGNALIDDYLKIASRQKDSDKTDIISDIAMVLERKTVLEQKEYFNPLLKKFGIDYQIR
ncbi:hypothetical protein IJ541_00150 [bacterium]|nr:hypothetical protein [bacterium]